jgi:hypothetical protein
MAELDVNTIIEKHTAFWNRDSVDQPLLNVSSIEGDTRYDLQGLSITLADGSELFEQDEPLTPDQLDPSTILHEGEFPLRTRPASDNGPLIVDDLMVTRAPLGKMAWVEAILGCPIVPKLDTGSIYSAPYLRSPGELDKIPSLNDNAWYDLLLEFTRQLAEDAAGSYQVVQCLQRGPIDLMSALLGHSRMCYAIYDEPEQMKALTEKVTEIFIEVAKGQEALIPKLNGGICTPFAVWAPGTVVRTQCDVTSSVSAKMYEEVFFPYDVEICKNFDYSIVHLHSGYLHTVEVLLKQEYPTAVQVSLDTGSTPFTVHDLIPVFARVLEEKPLFIQGKMTQPELDELLEVLPPRGLYISTSTMNEE